MAPPRDLHGWSLSAPHTPPPPSRPLALSGALDQTPGSPWAGPRMGLGAPLFDPIASPTAPCSLRPMPDCLSVPPSLNRASLPPPGQVTVASPPPHQVRAQRREQSGARHSSRRGRTPGAAPAARRKVWGRSPGAGSAAAASRSRAAPGGLRLGSPPPEPAGAGAARAGERGGGGRRQPRGGVAWGGGRVQCNKPRRRRRRRRLPAAQRELPVGRRGRGPGGGSREGPGQIPAAPADAPGRPGGGAGASPMGKLRLGAGSAAWAPARGHGPSPLAQMRDSEKHSRRKRMRTWDSPPARPLSGLPVIPRGDGTSSSNTPKLGSPGFAPGAGPRARAAAGCSARSGPQRCCRAVPKARDQTGRFKAPSLVSPTYARTPGHLPAVRLGASVKIVTELSGIFKRYERPSV